MQVYYSLLPFQSSFQKCNSWSVKKTIRNFIICFTTNVTCIWKRLHDRDRLAVIQGVDLASLGSSPARSPLIHRVLCACKVPVYQGQTWAEWSGPLVKDVWEKSTFWSDMIWSGPLVKVVWEKSPQCPIRCHMWPLCQMVQCGHGNHQHTWTWSWLMTKNSFGEP